MKRISIIQHFINERKYSLYLEIGTFAGGSFLPIKCKKKIAVDPQFRLSKLNKFKWYLQNPTNFNNSFFELTSDEFFERVNCFSEHRKKPDIVFIDGLHTFEASLMDTLNSLKSINEKGIILIHDCFPPHKAASTPAKSYEEAKSRHIKGWNGQWCGDVWKNIVYLKKKYSDELEVYTINTDFGIGVVQFTKPKQDLDLTIDRNLFKLINKLEFEELVSNPSKLINIKSTIQEKGVN